VAASEGHHETVRVLAAAGANLELARLDDGTTPVYIASYHGYQRVVDIINAYERRRIGRDKRHVGSVARQIGLPEDMEGVIGSLLKSNI